MVFVVRFKPNGEDPQDREEPPENRTYFRDTGGIDTDGR
jgi:hypothetical protein